MQLRDCSYSGTTNYFSNVLRTIIRKTKETQTTRALDLIPDHQRAQFFKAKARKDYWKAFLRTTTQNIKHHQQMNRLNHK